MAKPKKIKKKKSFMFTTRHYSVFSIVAFLLSLCTFSGILFSVIMSYEKRGNAGIDLGGAGLFSMLAAVCGIFLSLLASKERDIYQWVPRTALVINSCCAAVWIILIIIGYFPK